jgi:hypothetical protein
MYDGHAYTDDLTALAGSGTSNPAASSWSVIDFRS